MNQRKVVGALSIVLLAILFITIGCGDGQRRSRTNTRKSIPTGRNLNPPANSKEAQEKLKNIDSAKKELADAVAGEPIAALEAGEYTIEEILTHVEYIKGSYHFAVVRKSRPTVQANGNVALNAEPTTRGAGLIPSSPDRSPREILIPLKMTVAQGSQPNRNSPGMTSVVFSTQVVLENVKMKLADQFSQNQNAALALLDILASAEGGRDNEGIVRKVNVGGKEAVAHIYKNGDRIVVRVRIAEGAQATTNQQSRAANESFSRSMVFSYKVVRAAAPAPAAPAPAAPPAAPTEPVAAPTGEPAPGTPQPGPGSEINTGDQPDDQPTAI